MKVIDLNDPPEETLVALGEEFQLHELAVEDAVEAHHQRPKLDQFGELLSVVVKTVVYDDATEQVAFGELLALVGPEILITIRHGHACQLPATADMRVVAVNESTYAGLHGLLDFVTDEYGPVMDAIENDLYEIEQDVFSPDRTNPAQRIYRLKREVLTLRRNVSPLVRPLSRLSTDDRLEVPDDLRDYFSDVEDHVRRVVDRVVQADALLSEVLEANLAQLSVQQNEDMRRMTAWAVLFLVPTLLAGVWGMNFARMPELEWVYGYPLALGSMVGVTGYFWYRLKKAKWL